MNPNVPIHVRLVTVDRGTGSNDPDSALHMPSAKLVGSIWYPRELATCLRICLNVSN